MAIAVAPWHHQTWVNVWAQLQLSGSMDALRVNLISAAERDCTADPARKWNESGACQVILEEECVGIVGRAWDPESLLCRATRLEDCTDQETLVLTSAGTVCGQRDCLPTEMRDSNTGECVPSSEDAC